MSRQRLLWFFAITLVSVGLGRSLTAAVRVFPLPFPVTLAASPTAPSADSSCSNAGQRSIIDGESQCSCRVGYSGMQCQVCAVGFERNAAGACALGSAARRHVCFDKGTPYLNTFGEIACKCDSGLSGPACGGPVLKVRGYDRAVAAGGRLALKVSGGSGSYRWELVTPRGALLAGTSSQSRTYLAPTDVRRVEMVRVRVVDASSPAGSPAREFDLTLTPPKSLAVTGVPVADLASFDQAMLDYMKGRGIRAGVLAVAKDGHLVLSRGYGYMDKGADADPFVHDEGGKGLVGPSTPMRLASITKPITAAAVREALVAQGLTGPDGSGDTSLAAMPWVNASLGDPMASLAEQFLPYTADALPPYVETDLNQAYETCPASQVGPKPDARWDDITIQHLLAHGGGFDRTLPPSPRWTGGFVPPPSMVNTSYLSTTGDPNFKPAMMVYDLATATGTDYTGPLRPKALVQYMAGLCLSFSPGTQQKYSNFGYTLLGRVLEGLHDKKWAPGDGQNRRYGWGPYIDLIGSFLAGHGVTGIRAGGTGSYSSDNPDTITTSEPYYRHLNDDGGEPTYLNVGDTFGVAPNGDMYFGGPTNVPAPYGGFSMQTMESHGGLVASGPGLIKFMRRFRLRPSAWGDIGVPRTSTSIGGASHSGLLPGTYGLAWQMSGGDVSYTVPALIGAWDQTSDSSLVVGVPGSCTLPTGIDVVALFAQSQDPKDKDVSEYGKISHFLVQAACQVLSWPNPLPNPVAWGQ